MVSKPFNQKLFDANDSAAREAVTAYLQSTEDCSVTHNPDRFGIDLIVRSGLGNERGVEVEVKRVWTGEVFPWQTVQLPARKGKFLRSEMPVEFWILNADLSQAWIIPGDVIAHMLPEEVPNKYVRKGEKFYQVPISLCKRIEL